MSAELKSSVRSAGEAEVGGLRPRLSALPPLSLYIHVPWCERKCPYCDFNSHELRAALPEDEFVAALVADLERFLPQIWGRGVHTVFFGGGTPSLLSGRAVDAILQAVRARVRLEPDAEITLESNPGSADAARFAGYRAAGVTRLSLGVQSFHAHSLVALGRIHDERQARAALDMALRTFASVNVDLMYALPRQSAAQALADIETAIGFGPQQISAYHLTLEPNTPFHRNPPPLPDDDTAAAMQEAIEQRLAQGGYAQYETSAFARPGGRCAHNLNYWRFGDYVGIGPGAHSKVSFPDRITRVAKHKHPRRYLESAAVDGAEQQAYAVSADDLPFEFMMNALRLTEGFELRLYPERTGLPLTTVLSTLDAAEREGLLERDHRCARPTLRGRRFLNDLLQKFLPR